MSTHFFNILFLMFFCLSCSETQKPSATTTTNVVEEAAQPDISPNENKGLRAVVAHYGGQGHFLKGSTPATANTPAIRTFEIELSNSKKAETQKEIIGLTSSNMANLFYKELVEERKQYDEIHSVIILSDGKKITTKYPVGDLDVVLKKMDLLHKVVEQLKTKNYIELSTMLNNKDLFSYDKSEVIENIKAKDAEYGDIQSFEFLGFSRKKTTDGQRILHLAGYLNRTKKNNGFSIDVAMDGDKEEVYFLQNVL